MVDCLDSVDGFKELGLLMLPGGDVPVVGEQVKQQLQGGEEDVLGGLGLR